jgi:hypothetical protein
MTKRAARQVFDENRDLFTKLEFHDDLLAQERAAKKAAKQPAVFNVPEPVVPEKEVALPTQEDAAEIEALFNEDVLEQPTIHIESNPEELADIVVEQPSVPQQEPQAPAGVDDLLDI